MFFKDHIKNLQKLPELSRRRILVGTSISITAFIFIVWLSVKLYGLSVVDLDGKKNRDFTKSPFEEIVGAIDQLTKTASSGFGDVKKILEKQASSSLDSVTASTSELENYNFEENLNFAE
jgi:hypothetical protein